MLDADMDLSPSPSPISSPIYDCIDSGKNHIGIVEILVVLAVAAMFILHILGSLRRRSSHGGIHALVMGVSTLSYPLVSFTIGRMRTSDWYLDDFPVWAVFMLLLLGSTDNLTVCHLNDIDNWKSIYVNHLFKGFLVVYVVVNITMLQNHHFRYLHSILAILFVGVLKWYQRIAAMRMVSKSYLCKNMKVIAEYMKHKDNQLRSFDPVTMEGYKYMVAGEKYCTKRRTGRMPWYHEDGSSSKVTTVEQIWQCTGNLLLHERGMLLKDVCLSMALSKMLNRRFAGFMLSEAKLPKTHDFVFKGLLAGDKPHQRAFRVIEEELVFVHDLYYTRYSYLYQKGRYLALCLPIIMFGLCSWLTYLIVRDRSKDDPILSDLTIFITVVLAFLELYQLYLYVASGWFKVALIRSYVTTSFLQRRGCFHEMILGLLLRLQAFRPWKNRLGQYCVIQELGHKSRASNCLHYATLRLVDKAKNKKGCKKSVKLSENVKKAIVETLLGSNGHLTNGVTSLKKNGVHGHLSWACDGGIAAEGSVTRTILVWHIATTLCEHQLDTQAKKQDVVRTASTLSQYCLQLLAFAPHLLPDHISISESILDEVIEKAGEVIEGAKTMKDKCEKLRAFGTHIGPHADEAMLVIAQGARLASYLLEHVQEMRSRWKVLSDFWAEMMLYISPSDDARAHLETLARGGEFITHLWALLTHAGVLNRVPTGPNDVV
ncbi:hypothetical protein BDA96_05G233300 [Sorghum bicolor]|uniref:DUF4220 domain-containing protein n=1 Tax=Sorghum bicolor TaxID=4558 RepID=A0A921UGT4_SORBI|nr:hypothetical protein BDA96_05G233300 [Sorghum bicolor]